MRFYDSSKESPTIRVKTTSRSSGPPPPPLPPRCYLRMAFERLHLCQQPTSAGGGSHSLPRQKGLCALTKKFKRGISQQPRAYYPRRTSPCSRSVTARNAFGLRDTTPWRLRTNPTRDDQQIFQQPGHQPGDHFDHESNQHLPALAIFFSG